ncbi:MAG: hypothetical protein E8D40_08205 [Nitrospira sp.]|nr:MAG: hypothetical protein E8D40_08205 [Nitrospira sp.]
MMKPTSTQERFGNAITNSISVAGLVLVWAIIWANVPSKEELFSAPSASSIADAPRVLDLDLTIPGVTRQATDSLAGSREAESVATLGGVSALRDSRARQIAEMKCEAEVQQYCPDSLVGENRRRCVVQRMKRLDPPCQQIVRQRLVRWTDAEGSRLACADDVKRVCITVQPGDGRILQCLQAHEQELSEGCYQSLPKGRLHLRN